MISIFNFFTILFNAIVSLFGGENTFVLNGLGSLLDKLELIFANFVNSIVALF